MINNIKVERARNSLTQSDLAERVGVSRQTINSIETKKYIPSTVLALKIAKILKVPFEELFQLDKDD